MPASPVTFSLSDLRERFARLIPASFAVRDTCAFWMQPHNGSAELVILAPTAVLGLCLVLQSNLAKELRVTGVRGSEHHYWLAGNYVREQVPADAILLTWQLSGSSLFYNTQPIVRWDLTEPVDFARLCRAAAALHRPIYAPLFAFEKAALQKKLGGAWVAVGHPGIVTVWRLAAPSAPEVAR